MLPYPYDTFVTPVVLIDQSHVTYIPQISAPEIQHVLPAIVTRIRNKAGLEAPKNPVRMFCYNLMSQNNWQNPYFDEVFQLVTGHLLLLLRDHQTAGATALSEQSVDAMLTMYSSSLVFIPEYAELKSVISPQQFEACSQNAGMLYQTRKELENMNQSYHGHQPQYPMMNQGRPAEPDLVQDARTGQVYDRRTGMVVGHAPPPVNTGYPAHMFPQQPMHQYPGMQPHPGVMQHALPQNQHFVPYSPGGHSRMPVVHKPDVTFMRDYSQNNSNTVQPVMDNTVGHGHPGLQQRNHFQRHGQYEPEVVLSPTTDYRQTTHTNRDNYTGAELMDRSKHDVPNVSGTVTIAERQQVEAIAEAQAPKVEVLENLAADLDFNVSIESFRAETLAAGITTLRQKCCIVPVPLLSTIDIKPFLDVWTKGDTLSTVALALQSAMATASSFSTPSSKDPIADIRSLKALIREFDLALTRRVNTFLKQTLEATFIMQSFMEDYNDVPHELRKQMGMVTADRMAQFDRELVGVFKNKILSEYMYGTDFLETMAGIYIAYIPCVHTVTLVALDRNELKLPMASSKIYLGKVEHALLYRVAESIFDPKEGDESIEGVTVDSNFLVTRDGARYFVGNDSGTNKYYLRQV